MNLASIILRFLLRISFIFPLLCCGQQTFTFDHNGIIREYILYLPNDLNENAPLIFVLHGFASSAQTIMTYSGMNGLADANGFAVCYPQGTEDIGGTTHWNANLNISNTDDKAFLSELATFLQSEYLFSPDYTFICGMSNGGFMSYALACEQPDIFKAMASVTGTMSGSTWENCNPDNPVPVLQISGTLDQVVPMDGSMSPLGGWGGAPAMSEIIDFWVELNGLDKQENGSFSDIDSNDGSTVIFEKHSSDNSKNEVWLYTVQGGRHAWPGAWGNKDIAASEEIWKFFSQFTTDQTTAIDKTIAKNSLRIFPNPTMSTFEISGLSRINTVQIIDTESKLCQSLIVTTDPVKVDLSALPTGMYLIAVLNNNEAIRVEKILKL